MAVLHPAEWPASSSMRLGVVLMVAAWAPVGGCAEPGPSVRASIAPAVTDPQCREWQPIVGIADSSLGGRIRPSFGSCQVETVASDSPLRRDATGWSSVVGHVTPGERLTVLDRIDRRLQIFGRVVYDGGHWLKVQGARGNVGWVPAGEVRELSGPCQTENIAVIDDERSGRSELEPRGRWDSGDVSLPADPPAPAPKGSPAPP